MDRKNGHPGLSGSFRDFFFVCKRFSLASLYASAGHKYKHIALSSLSCSTFVLKMSLRERQQRETFWFFFANVSVCFRKKHFVGASTSVCCDLILNSIHPWSDVYWKEIDSRKQCKEKSRTKHVIWFGCCVLELRFLCCMHIAQTWANTKNHR